MKLRDSTYTEVDGDEFEGIEASISSKNTSYIFELVSSRIYRRPIESIVREITSNCFDSHIEAKVDDAVLVEINEDDGGEFISFVDVGIGMSPDRIKNVYMSIGESTKRESDEFIGAFGLGSKVPFAYTSNFLINTIYDGIRYEYVIHKGAKGIPKVELILEEESVEHNGTEIKIYMEKSSDVYKFIEACKSELIYFDNVVFRVNTKYGSIENNYVIYVKNNFKLRTDIRKDTHLCIGKVFYPIDWSLFNDFTKIRYLGIALSFNIGDLVVTPERESIRYVDFVNAQGEEVNTETVIRRKLKAVIEELEALYNDSVDIYYDNLEEYCAERSKEPFIKFGDYYLNIGKIVDKKKIVFTPLKNFKGTIPLNPYFMYQVTMEYNKNFKLRKYSTARMLKPIHWENGLLIRLPENQKISRKKIDYLYDLASDLGLPTTLFVINKVSFTKQWISYLGIPKITDYAEGNRLKQYQLYTNVVEKLVVSKSYDVSNLFIPDTWLKDYNLKNKKKCSEGKFLAYDYSTGAASKTYITTSNNFTRFTGILLYGFEEDELYLKGFAQLFKSSKKFNNGSHINSQRCRIYKIAKRNEKYFDGIKNATHITNFMSNNRVFKKYATSFILKKQSTALKFYSHISVKDIQLNEFMELAFSPVGEAISKVKEYYKDNGGSVIDNETLSPVLIEELTALALEQNIYDPAIINLDQKLTKYLKNLELLKYVHCDINSFHLMLQFIKLHGKPVNALWQSKNSIEYQIIQDYAKKAEYVLSIVEDRRCMRTVTGLPVKRYSTYREDNNNYNITALKPILTLQSITNKYYEYTEGN